MGIVGIAIDVGRMYYVKSELQAFCDSSVVSAALLLDGTSAGITAAQAAVTSTKTVMKWDIGTKTITDVATTFAKGQAASPNTVDSTTWTSNPPNAQDYRFVQVFARVNSPLTFMRAIQVFLAHSTATTAPVTADSIAAQAMITDYPVGLLPFSPIAPAPNAPDNFGLTPGTQYTLRYPSVGAQNNWQVCPGDQSATYWNNLPSQDRGFWGSTSAAALRGEIVDDQQLHTIYIGDPVPMVGGNKTTEGAALATRVNEDSDTSATTYAQYMADGTGNGRRIIGVPINSGPTVVSPYDDTFIAVGIGAFFLETASVYNAITGSTPICAEYIGPYVQGKIGSGGGQSNNTGSTGGYVVRMVY